MDSFIPSDITNNESMAAMAASLAYSSPADILVFDQAPLHMYYTEENIHSQAKDTPQVPSTSETVDYPATVTAIPHHLINQFASLSSSVTPSESPFLTIDAFDESGSSGQFATPSMHNMQHLDGFLPQGAATPLAQFGDLPISMVEAAPVEASEQQNMFAFSMDSTTDQFSAALVADAVAAAVSPNMMPSTVCLDPQALHTLSSTPMPEYLPEYSSQLSDYAPRSSTPLMHVVGNGLNMQCPRMGGPNPVKLNHRLDRIRHRRALSIGDSASLQAAVTRGIADRAPQTCQYPYFASPHMPTWRTSPYTPMTSTGVVRHRRTGSESVLVSPYQSVFNDSYHTSSRNSSSSSSPQMRPIHRRPRGHSTLSTMQDLVLGGGSSKERSPKHSGESD
ncbi:hypothetical protein FBU59_003692, partial [Linderina macrospora]